MYFYIFLYILYTYGEFLFFLRAIVVVVPLNGAR